MYTYYVQALGYKTSRQVFLAGTRSAVAPIFRLSGGRLKASSLKARTATLLWERNAKAGGYQIRMSFNRSFTNSRSIGITNPAIGRKVISNLTSGKTYFFQIRSYKLVSGKRYFGSWSSIVSVKIK